MFQIVHFFGRVEKIWTNAQTIGIFDSNSSLGNHASRFRKSE